MILSLKELNKKFHGDRLRSRYEGGVPTSIKGRVDLITYALWSTTSAPTKTFIKNYDVAASQFDNLLVELKKSDDEIKLIESKLEKYGAPFTPGRFPTWRK